jgi:hypothetical protein
MAETDRRQAGETMNDIHATRELEKLLRTQNDLLREISANTRPPSVAKTVVSSTPTSTSPDLSWMNWACGIIFVLGFGLGFLVSSFGGYNLIDRLSTEWAAREMNDYNAREKYHEDRYEALNKRYNELYAKRYDLKPSP